MTSTYNLIDEAWIGCLMPGDVAETKFYGLREVLTNARNITEILGESPPVTIALHRLLLAILHRALNAPKNYDDWQRIWENDDFDTDKINSYLEKHRSAFDLFDEARPFYQTTAIGKECATGIDSLFFQSTTAAEHFGDKRSSEEMFVPVDEAARLLVAFQAFDFGGTKSHERGKEKDKYTSPALLFQSAVCLVRGENLFKTLMLNLHRYDGEYGEPFDFEPDEDLPAWEQKSFSEPQARSPKGYADWLTWQSRRLRLFPEEVADGKRGIRRAVMMKGWELPKGYELHSRETMLAFYKKDKPEEGRRAWGTVSFNENKALWRDSLAFIQRIAEQKEPPKIFSWLKELANEEIISNKEILKTDFYGIKADSMQQAKLLLWRHERLLLPFAYFSESEGSKLCTALGAALTLAEKLAGILFAVRKRLATLLLVPQIKPLTEEQEILKLSKNTKDKINDFAKTFNLEAFYWSRLETPFKKLMLELPTDVRIAVDEDSDETKCYGDNQLRQWAQILRQTATAAFENTERSFDTSARNLKAAARARRLLNVLLREELARYEIETEETK